VEHLVTAFLKRIADASWFQNFITAVILLAGVVVGIETYPSVVEEHGTVLHFLNEAILWIFVVEVVVKMGAEGKRPWRYFLDPWNVFDFVIVAVCFLPVDAQYVAVLRLARLMRVLKLVRALPKLQILVSALLKSIPSMGYVALLLSLLFYVYSVAAVFLFGPNDPVHFESLPLAMLSLFRVVTGEDWTDIMYIAMYGCANYGYDGMEQLCTQSQSSPVFGALFFVSFMLLGAMVILNLFIGVIMGGMDEAKKETELEARTISRAQTGAVSVAQDIDELLSKLGAITDELEMLKGRIAKEEAARKAAEAAASK
jgi:voltage-gated sodium channel